MSKEKNKGVKALLVTALVLAGAGCASMNGADSSESGNTAEIPAESVVKMYDTTPNGNLYSWRPGGIYISENQNTLFLDYFRYDLINPYRTVDDILYISLEDLERIYAPDFTVEISDARITLSHASVEAQIELDRLDMSTWNGKVQLEAAPFAEGKQIYVPFLDFMVKGFGKILTEQGGYFGLGNNAEFAVTRDDTRQLKMFFRGKPYGKSYWTYWNDSVGRLEAVTVYIPGTYNPAVPNKMIVQLHGATGNATSIPDSPQGTLMMEYAESYGYIVMWPESYYFLGNFGMKVPPYGMFPVTAETDPQNPAGYSEGQLRDIELSGENVQLAMDYVESRWNISGDRVFLMGISMGGCGTWYQVAAYPERFAACSPSGAFVEPAFFDWQSVTTPALYVGGTEDRNGYDLMLDAYETALGQGANIVDFITVGGALHGSEWPRALQETYEFFDSFAE